MRVLRLSMVLTAFSVALFLVLNPAPGVIWLLFGLVGGAAGDFAFRRAGMTPFGIAVIAWSARAAGPSPRRRTLAVGVAVMTGTLAAPGLSLA